MIRGLHGLFYSSEPDAARAFLRDMLRLPFNDVGGGWLIFDLPEADVGVHPVEPGEEGGAHDVSFYCDDIEGTVADLKSRGVEFESEIADRGYGFVTYLRIPGGLRVQLYEPKYAKRQGVAANAEALAPKAKRRTAAKRAAAPKAATKRAPKTGVAGRRKPKASKGAARSKPAGAKRGTARSRRA